MNKLKNAIGKRGKNQASLQKSDDFIMDIFRNISRQVYSTIPNWRKKQDNKEFKEIRAKENKQENSIRIAKIVLEKGKRAGVYLINPFKGLHPTYKKEIKARKERQKMRISGALNQHLSSLKTA